MASNPEQLLLDSGETNGLAVTPFHYNPKGSRALRSPLHHGWSFLLTVLELKLITEGNVLEEKKNC